MARIEPNDSDTLSVKLPPALGGERIELARLRFGYCLGQLRQALAQQGLRAASTKEARAAAELAFIGPRDPKAPAKPVRFSQTKINGGTALTWRFVRQDDGQ